MTPEERELLEKTYSLVKENTKILRSVERRAQLSFLFKTLYWVVIIGSIFGAYYFIQPYIDSLRENFDFLKNNQTLENIDNILGPNN